METDVNAAPPVPCAGCGAPLAPEQRFCPRCGRPVQAAPAVHTPQRDLDRFFMAIGLIAAYVLGSYLVDSWGNYRRVLAFDAGFFILVASIAYAMRRDLGGALRPTAPNAQSILTYLILQCALSWTVFRGMPLLEHWFHLRNADHSSVFRDSPQPLLFALLSTAVFPALTEELAFRGILFGQLQRLTGATNAVIVTGILFACVHFSFLSLYWLLPCGLLYGWIRAREGHIWYGVALHALHNGLVVLAEFDKVPLLSH